MRAFAQHKYGFRWMLSPGAQIVVRFRDAHDGGSGAGILRS